MCRRNCLFVRHSMQFAVYKTVRDERTIHKIKKQTSETFHVRRQIGLHIRSCLPCFDHFTQTCRHRPISTASSNENNSIITKSCVSPADIFCCSIFLKIIVMKFSSQLLFFFLLLSLLALLLLSDSMILRRINKVKPQFCLAILHDRPRAAAQLEKTMRHLTLHHASLPIIVVDGSRKRLNSTSYFHPLLKFSVLGEESVGAATFTHALKLVEDCAEFVGFINSNDIGDSDETIVRMQSLVDDLIERQR